MAYAPQRPLPAPGAAYHAYASAMTAMVALGLGQYTTAAVAGGIAIVCAAYEHGRTQRSLEERIHDIDHEEGVAPGAQNPTS